MPGPNSPYTSLDANQVLQQVFDEANDRLRVDTEATIVAGAMEVAISHVDDSIKVGDGTDLLAVNTDGSINITDNGGSLTVDATNLDIRDLTHTTDSIKIGDGTDLLAVNSDGSININVDGVYNISTNPLPDSSAIIAHTRAASPIESDQSKRVTAISSGTSTALDISLHDSAGSDISLGQKTMASSVPVVLASNQSSIQVEYADTPNIDAFGRLRISNPRSIFDMSFQYDIAPNEWNYTVSGGATVTHGSPQPAVKLSTTTVSGDEAIFQTYRYFHYQPGKSQKIVLTGNFDSLQTNSRKRWGQFDVNNGYYFEFNNTTLSVNLRSSVSGSPVNTSVNQSSWNKDKLDGTGTSGITLDPTKQHLWFIEYTWFGTGAVRFGVFIGKQHIYVHEFTSANIITTPYSQTATLPLRIELTNTGTTAGATNIYLTCTSILSEGDYNPDGLMRSASNRTTAKALTTTGVTVPVISLRKASSTINVPVRIMSMSPFIATADDILFEIIKNPTLTGATFATTIESCNVDTAATALTGGSIVHSFYMSAQANGMSSSDVNSSIFDALDTWLGATIGGTSDIITLAATSLTAAAQVYGAVTWKEFD